MCGNSPFPAPAAVHALPGGRPDGGATLSGRFSPLAASTLLPGQKSGGSFLPYEGRNLTVMQLHLRDRKMLNFIFALLTGEV